MDPSVTGSSRRPQAFISTQRTRGQGTIPQIGLPQRPDVPGADQKADHVSHNPLETIHKNFDPQELHASFEASLPENSSENTKVDHQFQEIINDSPEKKEPVKPKKMFDFNVLDGDPSAPQKPGYKVQLEGPELKYFVEPKIFQKRNEFISSTSQAKSSGNVDTKIDRFIKKMEEEKKQKFCDFENFSIDTLKFDKNWVTEQRKGMDKKADVEVKKFSSVFLDKKEIKNEIEKFDKKENFQKDNIGKIQEMQVFLGSAGKKIQNEMSSLDKDISEFKMGLDSRKINLENKKVILRHNIGLLVGDVDNQALKSQVEAGKAEINTLESNMQKIEEMIEDRKGKLNEFMDKKAYIDEQLRKISIAPPDSKTLFA